MLSSLVVIIAASIVLSFMKLFVEEEQKLQVNPLFIHQKKMHMCLVF